MILQGLWLNARTTTDWRPLMDESSARMLTSLNRPGGAVAQLGARLDGIEEVVGSNPIGSTKDTWVQPGDMGYCAGYTPETRAEWVVDGFQHPRISIEEPLIFYKNTCPEFLRPDSLK
jgi:hypothetical protein